VRNSVFLISFVLQYVNATGSYQPTKQVKSVWLGGIGPCLSNVSYQGVSADGAIAQEAGVSLGRTDRYNKQYHTIRVQVLQDTAASRLAFYALGSEGHNTNTFAGVTFGNGTDAEEYVRGDLLGSEFAPTGKGYINGHDCRPCGGTNTDGGYASGSCWAFMPGSNVAPADSKGGAYADRALVVREWRAVLGGQEVVLPHLSLFKMSAEKVSLELSPPPGTLALLAGDFVEALVESVVLPMNAGDYYGSDAKLEQSLQTLDTRAAGVLAAEMSADSATATASWYSSRLYSHWQLAALEAVGNSPVVHVTVGELESAHPLRVRVDAATQAAAFTVSGGVGFVPITLTGVRTAGEFELLHRSTAENSTADPAERYFEWAKLDQSTDAANDFWQTDFDVETQQFSAVCCGSWCRRRR
jgi:hypothetical protein